MRPRVLLFGEPRSALSTVRPVGGRLKSLVCASSGELTTDTVRARCTPGVSFQAHYAFPRAQAPLGPHPRAGYLTTTQLGALDVRARQSQRRLLPSAHDSSAYRRAAGMLRDGGGAWACSKGMHLSESVPQDLMCLRSRCVAVRWIQPSDLYVTIEDCSSPSAEPPVPATVHWRQRAAFTSRTRDRQSSYNPQLCCVRAHSKRGSAISRRPLVDSRSDARCVLARPPVRGLGHF